MEGSKNKQTLKGIKKIKVKRRTKCSKQYLNFKTFNKIKVQEKMYLQILFYWFNETKNIDGRNGNDGKMERIVEIFQSQ